MMCLLVDRGLMFICATTANIRNINVSNVDSLSHRMGQVPREGRVVIEFITNLTLL
jgi:hypothetical protein